MTDSTESGAEGVDHHVPTANEPDSLDTSGVGNWVEEGGPLEPVDIAEVEAADAASAPADDEVPDELTAVRGELEERTGDLQRLQAEFLNYKRRVERDRDLIKENATYAALSPITEVLDTIDRAREHGPLDEGFRAVAEQLERAVAGSGLTKFGAVGEPFDPNLHEALAHQGEEEGVEVASIKVLVRSGIKIGDRVVRAAQVLVHGPMA